ncbi:MAG: hypothetical protein CO108_19770 [Deltaproteobacteria bacterium CG_4_9_14_3_um_filter_63_12]|nr:MAG: hypothetical protein CO108_19770 [Deltaproteobacteria bacterium CG_4_9_14_3_um_filter_63_12]
MTDTLEKKPRFGIWTFALGYLAAYVPYSAMTKGLTTGKFAGTVVPGFELLPPTVAASVVGMLIFISAMGWWKFAAHSTVMGISIPRPTRWTLMSGLCTGLIVVTTTMAYTIQGVSIVFAMLLMRGGVLIMSPVVDAITGRRVRWFSWLGLALSMGALVVAFAEPPKPGISRWAFSTLLAVDIGIYLASYFVRLRFMAKLAKSDDVSATKKYFVEEQIVATPSVLLLLAIFAYIGGNESFQLLRDGFTAFWSRPVVLPAMAVGICSQFTGVFGALVLLDKSETAFAVPVNRSSSILAGVFASLALHTIFEVRLPSAYQFAGAAMIIGAIVFLTIPSMMEKRRAKA